MGDLFSGLGDFTKAMYEAFPTFDVEVSIRKRSSRGHMAELLTVFVRLWDGDTDGLVYNELYALDLYLLHQLEGNPKAAWESIAEHMRRSLLKTMEEEEKSDDGEIKGKSLR